MKKLLLSITLVGACLTTFAQFKGTPTITFGVEGGINISSAALGSLIDAPGVSRPSKIGFHIGGLADFSFGTFSIQPGLLYSTKGDKATKGTSFLGENTLNYLEVPVNFLYKLPVGNGKVFFGAGPYLGYGLSATDKEVSGTYKIPFGSGSADFKTIDIGLNFVGGYQLNQGLMFKLGYGSGLTNLLNSATYTYKNRTISISAGYFFK